MQKKKNHRNIPIFIPHMGCPNMCVFCNQRSISGKISFDREGVKNEIDNALKTIPLDCEVEIAYFGGSFTGIERELMIYLLDLAQSYIDGYDGTYAEISGIRMSTRPDYINDEILNILSHYKISAIELGLQSMDDNVLLLSKRGHTSKQAEDACKMIVAAGFQLVGQMMIGLPGSDADSEIYTAKKICSLGASGARIYPTVVFYETELAKMCKRGEYSMLEDEDAIVRSAKVLEIFEEHGVDCIRIGLCASENLADTQKVMGGANHPAMGELVMGENMYFKMCRLLDGRDTCGRTAKFTVPYGKMSICIGQKSKNRQRLLDAYKLSRIYISEGDTDCVSLASLE